MSNATLALWIVAVGMGILGLISLAVVGATIYEEIQFGHAPDILSKWGYMIIGFLIGAFFTFARSILGSGSSNSQTNQQKGG